MKLTSTMTTRGRITVPLAVRNRLGLVAGDRIEFTFEGSQTVIEPVQLDGNPFKKFVGFLGTFQGGAPEINEWVADLRGVSCENGGRC